MNRIIEILVDKKLISNKLEKTHFKKVTKFVITRRRLVKVHFN